MNPMRPTTLPTIAAADMGFSDLTNRKSQRGPGDLFAFRDMTPRLRTFHTLRSYDASFPSP